MTVMLLGMNTEGNPVHPRKAFSPMEVTELPMYTEVRLEQLSNAELPMEVTV
jgi:hypothetical protein